MHEPSQELNELSHAVIGAAIDVHRELGPGYTPDIYENSLAVELHRNDMPFARHMMTEVFYKGVSVGQGRVDLLVCGKLLVAVRVLEIITPLEVGKVLSLLKAINQPLGLLINFNVAVLKEGIRRVILTPQYQQH